MRTFTIFAILGLAAGCSETKIQHVSDYGGVYESIIKGRVCDPVKNQWMEGATVYTHIVSDAGELLGTVTTTTDANGYYELDGLRDGLIYKVYVQSGSSVIAEYDVDLTAGGEADVPEPTCGGSVSGTVAVITGSYDTMGDVLTAAGITSYTLIDGSDGASLVEFLSSVDNLSPYQTVYFDGGHVEEDVIYDTDGSDTAGNVPLVLTAIHDYVAGGGKVVASDWSYDVVEQVWPDQIEFLGDDTVPNAAQLGVPMVIQATVADSNLAAAVGDTSQKVTFDLDTWPVIESVSGSGTVLQKGDITYQEGLTTTNETNKPLSVSFTAGSGSVVYMSWRMAANTDAKATAAIQYIIGSL